MKRYCISNMSIFELNPKCNEYVRNTIEKKHLTDGEMGIFKFFVRANIGERVSNSKQDKDIVDCLCSTYGGYIPSSKNGQRDFVALIAGSSRLF